MHQIKNIILHINVTLQKSIALEWRGYLFPRLDSIYNTGNVKYI